MKYFKNMYLSIKFLVASLLVFIVVGCNESFPNLLDQYGEAQDPEPIKNKVLMIVVDGLNGNSLREIAPANIRVMGRSGVVSYGSLSDASTDFEATIESGWASLLTGVINDKNGVKSHDLSVINTAQYPTIFTRLKQDVNERLSTLYTSDASIKEYLGQDATVVDVENDADLVNEFKASNATDESDLVIINLKDVDKVGVQYGYGEDVPEYTAAVRTMDQQIYDIVSALDERESYHNENWLVIIQSSKGGELEEESNDASAFGDSNRNTFTMFYSPKFVGKVISNPSVNQLPFVGNALQVNRVNDTDKTMATLSATHSDKFNMGADKSFTIIMFVKHNVVNAGYYYPSFFAKRPAAFSGNGFNFFLEAGYWGFNHSAGGGQVLGSNINDGGWHAIAIVVDRANQKLTAYTDGETKSTLADKWAVNLTAGASYDNTNPLRLGYYPEGNDNMDITIANIQFYNRAFTSNEIKRYSGITSVSDTHPFYNNLIGYWPIYGDNGTNKLTSALKDNVDFTISSGRRWKSFNEIVDYFQPATTAEFFRLVPNAVDIPFMVYQWFGVSIAKEWDLDGKTWSISYKKVRD